MGLMIHDIAYLLSDYQNLAIETIDGLERVKQIVSDLKSFTRQDDSEKVPVDVNECLRAALNILNNQTKYHSRVEVEYGELPEIRGYFGKLNQVFINLIANADQAVEENGLIRVETRVNGRWLEVSISDNGCGISEEHHKGKPAKPQKPGPRPKDQVNLTDEESRIMPASGGGFTQGFNAQACVDVATLLIIVAQTTQQVNDKQQIKPAIKELDKLRGQLGRVEELIADSGYFSQANVEACETAGMTPFIAVSR